ncbi:expressed unknown protein [Seminavis robusta]|uniref:U-box domain-containing protein n=1 Tax=Seminavis robusta TaxID=568900 RepID=A0A9N8F3D6_9STRA|nr:expressed unknown protein [Seminavis robusta]|eukprot:Sro4460_g354040.1 n/a (145) ;mRNA; f:896-1330
MSLENAPQHFLCPISMEVMSHPLQHKVTKHSFERSAIMEWIYFGKATCPLTRTSLHPEDFVENTKLLQEIQQWKNEHQIIEDEDDLDASFSLKISSVALPAPCTTKTAAPSSEPQSLKHLMSLRNKVLRNRDARAGKMAQQNRQ